MKHNFSASLAGIFHSVQRGSSALFFLKATMGATILTGKYAAAFKRADGTAIYALFERTYEANCYPHEPHWHCRAIGPYEDAVRAITRAMSACESQGLQARASMIEPEKLLASWYKHLAKPATLPDLVIEVGGAGRDALSDSQRRNAVSVLLDMQRADLAQQLVSGAFSVNLHADIDVVLRLFGLDGVLRPWQALRYDDMLTLPAFGFPAAFVPTKAGANDLVNPPHEVLRIDEHHLLVREHDRNWKCWGYQYSAVQRFMEVHCLAMELAKRLSSVPAIERFRQLCLSAQLVAADTAVQIRKPPSSAEDWIVRHYRDVATCFGAAAQESFSVTVKDAVGHGMLTALCNMPQDYVSWRVVAPVSQPPRSVSAIPGGQSQQLELIV